MYKSRSRPITFFSIIQRNGGVATSNVKVSIEKQAATYCPRIPGLFTDTSEHIRFLLFVFFFFHFLVVGSVR